MPRSAFFSKERIAAAGLEIIRRHGDGRNPIRQGGTEYFFRSSLNNDIKESYQLTDEKVLILYQQLNPLRTGFRKFILCVLSKIPIDYQLVTKPAAHNGPEMGPSCENQFVSN